MTNIFYLRIAVPFLVLMCFDTNAVELDWDDLGQANQTSIFSGLTLSPTDNTCSPGQTNCDITATVTFEILNDGQGGELECLWNNKSVCGRYYNQQLGGIDDGNLRFGLNATGADNDDHLNICVEFDRLTEGLTFDILDVDEIGWDDVIELYYTGTPSVTPMLARNDLVNGVAFGDTSTGVDPNRVVEHNPNFPVPNNEATGWGAIQPGGGNATSNDDGGNITIDFNGTQVWGFCVRYWAGPNSNANPPAQSIGLSALTWTSSTPVNMDEFSSKRIGNSLSVNWSTISETLNLGFNLWAEIDGEWQSLNRRIIPSNSIDEQSRLQYQKKIKLSRKLSRVRHIGISSIDTSGREEFYGPFKVGEKYGHKGVPEPIDWQKIVSESTQTMKSRGYIHRNGRWIHKTRRNGRNADRVNLEVSSRGMVRVTHDDLILNGLDLRGIQTNQIAVTHRGGAIPRYINVGNKTKRFNEASFIDFYARTLEGELALYNSKNVYQISLVPEKVLTTRAVKVPFGVASVTTPLVRSRAYEEDHFYQNVSTLGSPWLDTSIGWGASPAVEKEFDLHKDYIPETDLEITLRLMGGFDFPKVQTDHRLEVFVNDVFLGEREWGGFDAQSLKFLAPAASLVMGKNKLRIHAVPTEVGVALIHLDKFTIRYAAMPRTNTSTPEFRLLSPDAESTVRLENKSNDKVWAYASDEDGNLVRLEHKFKTIRKSKKDWGSYIILPMLTAADVDYWVLTESQFIKPDVTLASMENAEANFASLYIIADEVFIGDELRGYVNFKRSSGISTELISYQSLLAQYGHGLKDPYVIRSFLKEQFAGAGANSLLIVGGHTFDYLDRTKTGSISFIPTVYRGSRVVQYSPTDTPLVDLDSDGLPDVAVGRWPVRTAEQLSAIIDKSRRWALGEGLAESSSVLLIADNDDRNNAVSFSDQLNSLASKFDATSETFPGFWTDLSKVYASDNVNSPTPVAAQQVAIRNAMTLGSALTLFNGHGSPVSWSSMRHFDVEDVDGVDYQHGASILIPLACYTTYYESISNESLANKLLFKQNGGAVAIAGAATLGDYLNNVKIITQMMRQTADNNLTLGESLRLSKRSLGVKKIAQANLWALLADPTLKFNPSYQTQTSSMQSDVEE